MVCGRWYVADAKSVWSWRKIVESSAEFLCRLVGNDVSEWFRINVGLRQGCVMSPWLFDVYMDGVVQKVNVRVLGKWLELLSANGGRFEINQLLFADDTALVADSEEKLCRLVSNFGRVCERRTLRVNVGKSKVMRCPRYGNGDRMHVILNGEPLEEVDSFKYLGSQVAADGGCERNVVHRTNEVNISLESFEKCPEQ